MKTKIKSLFIPYSKIGFKSNFFFDISKTNLSLKVRVPEKIVPKISHRPKKKYAIQRYYDENLYFNTADKQLLSPYSFFYPGDAIALSQVGIIKNFIKGLQRPYFIRFYVRGIGYKVWPIYRYQGLKFRIGLNHKSLYLFPSEIIGRGRKYKFVLSSLNYHQLKQASVHVVSLKTPDPYRVKGIRFLNDNKFPKPRKEKRR